MTAYNREKYIAESIESVLASSYTNFELIIVDDCSKDNTVSIARKYAVQDNRIKIFINDSNLGDYPNRNRAAEYAQGTYIKYLDSDDLMSSDCLEHFVEGMNSHPECVFGITSKLINKTILHTPSHSYRVHFFERGILDLGPSCSIIKRDIFSKEGGFLNQRCVSDFEFWLRLAKKYSFLEFKTGLIFWRDHENQEMKLGQEEYIKYNFTIIKEKIKSSSLSKSEQKIIIKKYRKGIIRYLAKNIFKNGVVKTFNLLRMNLSVIISFILLFYN